MTLPEEKKNTMENSAHGFTEGAESIGKEMLKQALDHADSELDSLHQQLTDMKEVVKDLLPLAQEVFDSITIDDGESHKEYVSLKSLLSRAKALLDKK